MTPLQFKRIREKLGDSQTAFGKRIGKCRQTVERYESSREEPGSKIPFLVAEFVRGLSTGKNNKA